MTGVDPTEHMLAIAREKVPTGQFHTAIAGLPTSHFIPDAFEAALSELPLLLVWELERRGDETA